MSDRPPNTKKGAYIKFGGIPYRVSRYIGPGTSGRARLVLEDMKGKDQEFDFDTVKDNATLLLEATVDPTVPASTECLVAAAQELRLSYPT